MKWICNLLLKMEKLLKLLYGALRATVDNTLAGAQNLVCLGLILDELFHLAFLSGLPSQLISNLFEYR